MTCSESLEHLLAAELVELSGAADSPVAAHLRTCRRCRAVAARLGADTHALAAALDAGHAPLHHRVRRRRSSHQRAALATGLAAATATVVLWPHVSTNERGSAAPPASPAGLVASVVVSPLAANGVRPARPLLAALPRAYPKPRMLTATPPIEPTRLVVNGVNPPQALVVVEPQAGRRAAILRTADPSVTVVWLY